MVERKKSVLPEDAAYWDDLATRIVADAEEPLSGLVVEPEWYGLLSDRAGWVIGAALAAMLLLWVNLPGADPAATLFRWIETSLVPNDHVGVLVAGVQPPDVQALLVEFPIPTGGGEQ